MSRANENRGELEAVSADAVESLMAAGLALPQLERAGFFAAALAREPALRGELRARLAILERAGLAEFVEAVEASDAVELPRELGDFTLLEWLGSGGMGVVYRAEQHSLGRQVAVKLVRPEQLHFGSARERFRREVEAAARLQHPGIVPVYSVGEAQGVPYFAMELVLGCTLADALRALAGRAPESLRGADIAAVVRRRGERSERDDAPHGEIFAGSWVEACLGIARQVALALEHAHGRGILHRDVKPSNVALARDGRAMLLDFGLTSSRDGERITGSGAWVGTLRYMAPERLEPGGRVDPRTDVYSLGVTLYEMLCLQPPYDGSTPVETQLRIGQGQPDPMRARNRRVPLDACIVCLKAMDVDPSRRYASAAELARDIDNVLARRPIAARPPSAVLRLRRWVQRRPALAASLMLGALLGVGTPSALYVQARAHSGRLAAALAREQDATLRARELGERRHMLLELLIDSFRIPEAERAPGAQLGARAVLDRGARKLERALAKDPRARAELAWNVGAAYNALGEAASAEAVLVTAVATLREHESEPGELIGALCELADAVRQQGDLERADDFAREAHERAAAAFGEASWRTARTLALRAKVSVDAERFDEAEERLERALAILRADPRTPAVEIAEALARLGGARLLHASFAPEPIARELELRAEEELVEASGIFEREGSDDGELSLAALLNQLGLAAKQAGRLDEALELYERALSTARRYLADDSRLVAGMLSNLALLYEARGDPLAAIEPLRRSSRAFDADFADDPRHAVLAKGNLAGTLFRTGHLDEAAAIYEEVLPLQIEHYAAVHPFVAASLASLGHCHLERGELELAEALFRDAIDQFVALHGAADPRTARARCFLAELELARREPGRAAQIASGARAGAGGLEAFPDLEAELRVIDGRIAQALGRHEDARAAYESALALAAQVPNAVAPAEARARLGALLAETGSEREAQAQLERARSELLLRLAPIDPRVRATTALLAELYERDGRAELARALRAEDGEGTSGR